MNSVFRNQILASSNEVCCFLFSHVIRADVFEKEVGMDNLCLCGIP